MCGIVGLVGGEAHPASLERMLSCLNHRGPDHKATWLASGVGLGHARLTVQDLSDIANQPMLNRDGTLAIAFNGEIYNWQTLREELKASYPFRTERSDTEVVLAAYDVLGPEHFLARLEGMFAFAVVDLRRRRLVLARDRIGEKPLYYFEGQACFCFASEPRALTASGLVERVVDPQSVYHYLTLLAPKPGASFFKNIKKLKAGHVLSLSLDEPGKPAVEPYWDVANVLNRQLHSDFPAIVSKGRDLLRTSIEAQTQADVDVVIALSAGLDSSLNLLYAQHTSDVSAINATFSQTSSEHDERVVAARFAKDLNIELIELDLGPDDFDKALDELSSGMIDAPITGPDTVLLWLMAREVRKRGKKVLVVGEGGDELGAYPRYFHAISEYNTHAADPSCSALQPFLYNGRYISTRHCLGFYEIEKASDWIAEPPEESTYAILDDLMSEIEVPGAEGYARKILNVEYKLRLPDLLLARLDYASMLCSVEARAPFLGGQLIENVLSEQFSTRNRDQTPKAWIREVAKAELPEYIVSMPKLGFGQEFTGLLNTLYAQKYEAEVIDNNTAPIRSFLTDRFLRKAYQRHLYRGNFGGRLLILLLLNRWLGNQINLPY